MQKIVTSCYGGLSLSAAGIRRYAEIKGIVLYPEEQWFERTIYWTVPADRRPKSTDQAYQNSVLSDSDIPRDDPALIKVVTEMGKAASKYGKLEITEIPDGIEWQIEEYDGDEWVAEKHQTW